MAVADDVTEELVRWLMIPGDGDLAEAFRDLLQRPAWMERGACVGQPTEVFFPARGTPARAARAICAGCPVRSQCLDFALRDRETVGVWAGTTDHERRVLRARRAA